MKQVDELDQLNRKNFIVTEPHPERVLQFGEGNFLRAFVDWQFDKMNKLVLIGIRVLSLYSRRQEVS